MKRKLGLCALILSLVVCAAQAQEKNMAKPMMDMKAAKAKMMEPSMMMAAEKAMMSEQSMVPSMMAKEMIMHTMMHDEKSMAMMNKAAMMPDAKKTAMMDESKIKMAGDKMLSDNGQLQMLFQELVARHLASQKMAMMKKAPTNDKKMMLPMMNEASMMESRKEMMTGDAMSMMMARETLLKALMNDPDVMSMVEKQAKKLQQSAMGKMIGDEQVMMKSEAMAKDNSMVKNVMKDAMVRSAMEGDKMMMEKKK